MLRKISALLLLLLLLCGMSVSAQAAPQIYIGNITARPGDRVNVAVSIKDNPGMVSFTLKPDFDSELLCFEGYDYSNSVLPGRFEAGERIVWLGEEDCFLNGELFSLEFTVSSAAENGKIPISLICDAEMGGIVSLNLQRVGVELAAGSIEVKKAPIIGDGGVSDSAAEDLVLLRKILLKLHIPTTSQFTAADVNSDGVIDTRDLAALKKTISSDK